MFSHDSFGARAPKSRASLFGACAVAALGLGAAGTVIAAVPATLKVDAKVQFLRQHMAHSAKWKPMFLVKPPSARRLSAATGSRLSILGPGLTIPYWSTVITSPLDGKSYDVSMVGSSPYDAHPHNTNVTYVPVALRIHVGGFVFDPTAPTPSLGNPNPAVTTCDAQSPARRFFNSPLFRPSSFVSNGVNVSAVPGGTQLISAFQRANFWNAVKGTSYGVTLIPSRLDPIVVDWFPSNPHDTVVGVNDNCGGVAAVPLLDINEFDSELQAVAATYAHSNQIPITLAVDTAIYVGQNTGNCCVLGYHNAISVVGGTQVYATGAYFDTNGAFGPHFADTTIWSHELAELADDPFVQSIPGVPGGVNNDLTPAWGHTGQVFGCQNNLEAGDPLTPDQAGNFPNFPVTGVAGFVYHYQDLPFHDWFYRTASTSTGGKGSFRGLLAGGGQPTICS